MNVEACKLSAAYRAVDDLINSNCVVGIGSGSTMRYVLERLGLRCKEKGITVKCIPTSFQARQLIYQFDMPLAELEAHPQIDVAIDGADEVDENLVAIKGGGACLAQEKVVAAAAKKFAVVADYRKNSKQLCTQWTKGIPIEVLPMAHSSVKLGISRKFNVDYNSMVLREGREKAGPVITDNGNFVIDWNFKPDRSYSSSDWQALSDAIKLMPGVVETGIFANMISTVYFGHQDGTVSVANSSSP